MHANTVKNKKIRLEFFKQEKSKLINKFLFVNLMNSSQNLKKLHPLLSRFSQKTDKVSKVKIKNKCVMTGRNKSVEKKYSFSRIILLDMLRFGIIPGYKKAVW